MRVYLAPGDRIFRLLAAGVLLPLGLWLCLQRPEQPVHPRELRTSTITGLGFVVGIVGGIYGIGGGIQPHVPETGLRILLGALAVGLAITYITQAASR